MAKLDDKDADRVLRRVCFDFDGNQRWEPVEDWTALDDLMQEEEPVDFEMATLNAEVIAWPNDNVPAPIELQVLKREEAAAISAWARLRLMQWIFGSGPRPSDIAARVLAMAWARYAELTGPMTGKDIEEMFGQGRAAFSARMERLFRNPVMARLGADHEMKVPGQKSSASSAAYAENAKKHQPRAKSAHRDQEEEQREEIAGLKGAESRADALITARKLAAEREAEKTEQLFQKMKDQAQGKIA
jgi:hypothetical protein